MEGLRGGSKVRGVNLGGWLVVEGWIKPSLFDGIPNGDMLVRIFLNSDLSFLFFCEIVFLYLVISLIEPLTNVQM